MKLLATNKPALADGALYSPPDIQLGSFKLSHLVTLQPERDRGAIDEMALEGGQESDYLHDVPDLWRLAWHLAIFPAIAPFLTWLSGRVVYALSILLEKLGVSIG